MTEPVCRRTYFQSLDGERAPVEVRWMKPYSAEADWRCDFAIQWPGGVVGEGHAFGVDSVQALLMAFKAVGAELYVAQPPVYLFEPNDDLGLPVAEAIKDLPAARSGGRIF